MYENTDPVHLSVAEPYLKSEEGVLRMHSNGNDTLYIYGKPYALGLAYKDLPRETQLTVGALASALVHTRKLLVEALRNEARIMAPNEWRRGLGSLAHKTGCKVEDIEPIARSVFETLFTQMLESPPQSNKSRRNERRR